MKVAKRTDKPFFDKEQEQMIRDHMLKGAPDHEIERFLIVCERTGLDPFSRQIYGRVQKRKVKKPGTTDQFDWIPEVIIITSIDGFRAIAERSGEYRGQTAPEWYYHDDEGKMGWHDVFLPKRDHRRRAITLPEACRVGIIRHGFPAPCYGVANFDSFAVYEKVKSGDKEEWVLGTFWNRMPEHQIAKCAEAQGHRKAFPLLANSIYLEEEIIDPEKEQPETLPARSGSQPTNLQPGTDVVPIDLNEEHTGKLPAQKTKAAAIKKPEPKSEPPKDDVSPFGEDDIPMGDPEPKQAKRDAKDTWKDHVITGLTTKEYHGKKLGELTEKQIGYLMEMWVKKYYQKFKDNPTKVADADAIKLAFVAYGGKIEPS